MALLLSRLAAAVGCFCLVASFIGFIVGPLFAEWGKFVVSLAPVFAANLDANKACWDDADNVAKAERSIAQIDEAFAGSGAGAAAAARAESIGN